MLDARNPPLGVPEVRHGGPLRRARVPAPAQVDPVAAGAAAGDRRRGRAPGSCDTSLRQRARAPLVRHGARVRPPDGHAAQLAGRLARADVARIRTGPATGPRRLFEEMRDDVERLEKVSRRFELIGTRRRCRRSAPMRFSAGSRATSTRGCRPSAAGSRIELDLREPGPIVRGNETLLEWAFENLVKNALDSLAGREGTIRLAFVGRRRFGPATTSATTAPASRRRVRNSLFDVGVTTKSSGLGCRAVTCPPHLRGHARRRRTTPATTTSGASFEIELPLADEGGDRRRRGGESRETRPGAESGAAARRSTTERARSSCWPVPAPARRGCSRRESHG